MFTVEDYSVTHGLLLGFNQRLDLFNIVLLVRSKDRVIVDTNEGYLANMLIGQI